MTIFRANHNKNYTVVNNSICKDKRLSYKAKGIWLYAFSRPDDWQFNITDLINQSTDGKDAVSSGLRELSDAGYLKRERIRKPDGTYERGAIWDFYETPQELKECLPETENPVLGNPILEKPPLLSTEPLTSTEKTTTTTITHKVPEKVVAVFSDDLLKDLPLTQSEKASFSIQFDSDQLAHMVAYYKGRLSVAPDFVPDSWASYLANATRNGYAIPQKTKSAEEKPPVDDKKNETRAQEAVNHLTKILKEGEQLYLTSLAINYRNLKGNIMIICFKNHDFDLELNELYKIIKNTR